MSFDSAFKKTVLLEGGYGNDPRDAGGETKYGISKRAYPDLDIPNLTLDQARQIYLRDYWQKLRLDEIENETIQEEIFDTAINTGRRNAALIVQRALNFLGGIVVEDGVIGIQTIAEVNRWGAKDPEALFRCLNGFQFLHYVQCKMDSPQHSFPRGWMRRIQDYRG